jgi:hypothetical protein
MNRRKLLTIAGAFGAATLIACDMGDPAPKGGPGATRDPNTPPKPADADRDAEVGGTLLRAAKFSVWVEDANWPVRVTIEAVDHTTGERINVIDTPKELGIEVKGPGIWTVPLAYPAGHHVEVTIKATATAHKSAQGFVAFVDGKGRRAESVGFNGTAAAVLHATTRR